MKYFIIIGIILLLLIGTCNNKEPFIGDLYRLKSHDYYYNPKKSIKKKYNKTNQTSRLTNGLYTMSILSENNNEKCLMFPQDGYASYPEQFIWNNKVITYPYKNSLIEFRT